MNSESIDGLKCFEMLNIKVIIVEHPYVLAAGWVQNGCHGKYRRKASMRLLFL